MTDHGYLRVKGRRLAFEDGTEFVPVGLSLLGVTQLSLWDEFVELWGMTPEQWFDRLAEAGVNFLRVHMMLHRGGAERGCCCAFPELVPEHARLLEKNLPWYLDQCQKRDIYVGINLHHFAEFDWKNNPYNVVNNGPCHTIRDWVTNPGAVALFKKRIDFYNRFTAFRSFALWEITNELWDPANVEVGKDDVMVGWLTDLARYTKQVDPFHHPVGTNLHAMDDMNDPCFQKVQGDEAIDWISVHSYGLNFADQARHLWVVQSGKPVVGTESYNLADDLPGARRRTWEGLALFSTELEWSSGFFPDRPDWDQDLRLHFDEMLAILKAASGVARQTIEADRWDNPGPACITGAVATTDGRRLMAYFNRSDSGESFGPGGLPVGRYEVRWYDCVSGSLLKKETKDLDAATRMSPPGGEVFLYIRPE
jgi:hypothetical protein